MLGFGISIIGRVLFIVNGRMQISRSSPNFLLLGNQKFPTLPDLKTCRGSSETQAFSRSEKEVHFFFVMTKKTTPCKKTVPLDF